MSKPFDKRNDRIDRLVAVFIQELRHLRHLLNADAADLIRSTVGMVPLIHERLPLFVHVSVCGGGELRVVKLRERVGRYLPNKRQEVLDEFRSVFNVEQRDVLAVLRHRVLTEDKRVDHLVDARHFVCHRLVDVVQARETLEEVGNRAGDLHALALEKVYSGVDARHHVGRGALLEDAKQVLLERLVVREDSLQLRLLSLGDQLHEGLDRVLAEAERRLGEHVPDVPLLVGGHADAVSEVDDGGAVVGDHDVACMQVAMHEPVSKDSVLEPCCGEVDDVVAPLAEERLEVLEAAAGGDQFLH